MRRGRSEHTRRGRRERAGGRGEPGPRVTCPKHAHVTLAPRPSRAAHARSAPRGPARGHLWRRPRARLRCASFGGCAATQLSVFHHRSVGLGPQLPVNCHRVGRELRSGARVYTSPAWVSANIPRGGSGARCQVKCYMLVFKEEISRSLSGDNEASSPSPRPLSLQTPSRGSLPKHEDRFRVMKLLIE